MPAARDPLSVRYDRSVRRALMRAAAAWPRRAVQTWIASPGVEFRNLDQGGRTAHERAFIRSAYYQVIKVPQHNGEPQYWSLRLAWGKIERHGDRYGRTVTVRLFRYRPGAGRGRASSYIDNPALRSDVRHRVDGAG